MAHPIHTLLSIAVAAGALAIACSSGNDADGDKICKPEAYVFCRCQDRQEGQKLCNETGTAFGKCEPCESYDNPEYIEGSSGSSSGDYPPIEEDDAGSSSGNVPGACGDGIVQAGEDCDDDNADDADGCDGKCKLSGLNPPATQGCPGLEVHVWGGAHAPTTSGSTTGAGNRDTDGSCTNGGSTQGSSAPDRVFKVVAHKTGTLTVTTTETNYDGFLYVSDACVATNVKYLACSNAVSTSGGEKLTAPVEDGKTYYVFVDGAGTATGKFRVTFSIP